MISDSVKETEDDGITHTRNIQSPCPPDKCSDFLDMGKHDITIKRSKIFYLCLALAHKRKRK